MPVKGYQANAIKNAVEFFPLADADVGINRARMLGFDKQSNNEYDEVIDSSYTGVTPINDKPFFAEGGRGDELLQKSVFHDPKGLDDEFLKLPTEDEPTSVWPYRGFDSQTLDALTVISLAGVCSEILSYGNAEGGYADLSQLKQLFLNAESGKLSEKEMENRVKYAIGFGISQLRLNMGVLDDLAEVMTRDGSVAECIVTIESSENLRGMSVAEYGEGRQERLANDVGLFEKVLLGIFGENKKKQKQILDLQGDDPFYVALAAASIFFIWASSGGLSLH